ncbi:MAG: hypothetical protein C5B59_19920 [Bacteroidetes bacterium]|nr:MAG: hypothetical protein C5B59_19920 [Bacteroidota bacterium]
MDQRTQLISKIKTPDQRIRVFISSTIHELEEERKAAQEAISHLRLIPVLFELGARPHPPRDLYRSYLEQSQVFIGIYYNSYGWIAPDMEISGLEDEYRLSEGKPKLIYIKKSSSDRQEPLKKLLSHIQESDTVSYKNFSTANELMYLIENDLALLLSEKFDLPNTEEREPKKAILSGTIPVLRHKLLGREKEMLELMNMLESPEISLVTLTGTGGTGKTTMAIQLASDLKNQFKDGIYFVALASITDRQLLTPTIAHAVGIYDNGKQPIFETLIEWLADKQVLLLLDNFEQIVDAGTIVSELMSKCKTIRILVTSRIPLRIREEYVFQLQPLANPIEQQYISTQGIMEFPSVQLFIQRAKEVNPSLPLDEMNLRAIAEIVNQVDGLPLAIELAAIKTRYLPPLELLARMKKMLDMLSRGPRDLPERQQAMRATIEWSYHLLDEKGKSFFRRLSAFPDGWTLESAEEVTLFDKDLDGDILEVTEKLVDVGLISYKSLAGVGATISTRFNMLQVIREYALEMLNASGETDAVFSRHALYCVDISEKIVKEMWEPQWISWSHVFEHDYHNFLAGFLHLLKKNELESAWKILCFLNMLSVTCGRITEAVQCLDKACIWDNRYSPEGNDDSVSLKTKALTFQSSGLLRFFASDYPGSISDLDKSILFYEKAGDRKEKVRSMIWRGISGLILQDFSSMRFLNEGISGAEQFNDKFNIIVGKNFLAEGCMAMGEFEKARILIEETESKSRHFEYKFLLATSLVQKGNLLLTTGKISGAEAAFTESISLLDNISIKAVRGWMHIGLGFTFMKKNEWLNARQQFSLGLKAARESGDKSIAVGVMLGFAGIAAASGKEKEAANILGAADTLAPIAGYITHCLYQWVIINTKQKLGEDLFATEFANGRKIPIDKAIQLI